LAAIREKRGIADFDARATGLRQRGACARIRAVQPL